MKGARPLTPEEIQAVSQFFSGKYAVRDRCFFYSANIFNKC